MLKQLIVLLFVVASIVGNELDDIDIEAIKSKLPAGINVDFLENVNITSQFDETKKKLQDKCMEVSGGPEAFQKSEVASETLIQCVTGLINVTSLQLEIEEAKPNGGLDTVFNKYCKKRTNAIQCLQNFTTTIGDCLTEEENKNKQVVINIFTNLLNFVCYKEGDQIALFIAEKGPECFEEKKDGIINCLNATLHTYVNDGSPMDKLPTLVVNEKHCNEFDEIAACTVAVLEECETTTPGNLVGSAFKYIRNETPCANITKTASSQKSTRSSAVTDRSASIVLGVCFTAIVLAVKGILVQ